MFKIICFAYIIAAAFNDGWSGGFFALPFAAMLLSFEYQAYRRTHKLPINVIIFLLVCSCIYVSDRSDWAFVYPAVGEDIVVTQDGTVRHGRFFPFALNVFKETQGATYDVKQGSRFTITNQYKVGVPDFSVRYIYRVEPSDKEFEAEFIKNASQMSIDWYSVGNEYKKLPLDSVYMSTYQSMYRTLSFQDRISAEKFSIWNFFDILLVWIFLLPAIIIAAICRPKSRNQK